MRILAVEDEVTVYRGGSERSYFDVLTGLHDAGHEVQLVYIKEGNLLQSYIDAGIKTVQQSFSFLMRSGTKRKDLFALWRTASFVKNTIKPDVVYINFAEAIPLAVIIRLRLGIPVVCHIRISYSGLTRQILWAGKFVAAFIVINKRFEMLFGNAFKAKERVTVVYNGISVPDVFPPLRKRTAGEPLRILYLGRVAYEKGILELVKAFSVAVGSGVHANLQITGSFIASYLGDFKKELADAIAASGVSHLISINSAVDKPIEYIANYDLLVFPSTWDEGFGRTIPESIVAGTPVLARDIGMVKEIMIDNPDFVFATEEEFASKIIEFYHERLSFDFESARKTVARNFNKTRMVAEVEKKLLDVVGR